MKQARSLSIGFVFCLLLLAGSSLSQAPESINYQAVVRDNSGNPIVNQQVRFRLSILQGSMSGPVVYSESQIKSTNQLGLVNLAIGSGSVLSGTFSSISWGTSTYYLETEFDPTGGSSYQVLGITQFLSVPYALYAKSSGGTTNGWSLTGNTGSNPATNFIGTTDNIPLGFRVNNQKSGFIEPAGTTSIGYGALSSNSTGTYNTAFGHWALQSNTTGTWNTAHGYNALQSNTQGNANTATGWGALASSTGDHNTANGYGALIANNSGARNTAHGSISLQTNTSGNYNSGLGYGALYNNTTGNYNTAIGYYAGVSTANLSNATAIGASTVATASDQVRLGNDNVTSLFCKGAYAATTSNPSNLFVDNNGQIMRSTATGFSGWSLTGNAGTVSGTNFIGTTDDKAFDVWTANLLRTRVTTKGAIETFNTGQSVFLGEEAGASDDLTLNKNVFLGYQAGKSNTAGTGNVASGYQAFKTNTTGEYNTAIGTSALTTNTTGTNNTATGTSALVSNQNGNRNTAIGMGALFGNTSGNDNIAIGYMANGGNATSTNTIVLGSGTNATSSNQVRLGNDNVTSLFCKGAYAATTTASPNLAVDANGQIMRSTVNNNHVQLHAMTSATDHSASPNKMFYSDTSGKVKELDLGNVGQVLKSNGTTAAPSWMSDADSITKVILLTTIQRDSIPNPTRGMLIYNTDTHSLNFYNGTTWEEYCQPCTPLPSLAYAGPDQQNLEGLSTTLAANFPATGTGHWTMLSGSGGVVSNPSNPRSTFTGLPDSTYVLSWTITNGCGSSSAVVSIQFAQCPPDLPNPNEGPHIASYRQITWKWYPVDGSPGYRWNTVNDYATSITCDTSRIETGLSCGTSYARYVWTSDCVQGTPTILNATTLSQAIPPTPTAWIHVPDQTSIEWRWTNSSAYPNYKWNTTNNYASAINIGDTTSKTETGLTCGTSYTRYIWAYNNCGHSSPLIMTQSTQDCFVCGNSIIKNHIVTGAPCGGDVAPVNKTVTYNTVSYSNLCWITSNLGADHEATSLDDNTEASAGWYWQFNNIQGFKENGYYLTPPCGNWYGSSNLTSNWAQNNDPCSLELGNAWRLPTANEYGMIVLGSNPYNSVLKIHKAGGIWYSPRVDDRGYEGRYWSSSWNPSFPGFGTILKVVTGGAVPINEEMLHGCSVRCVRPLN